MKRNLVPRAFPSLREKPWERDWCRRSIKMLIISTFSLENLTAPYCVCVCYSVILRYVLAKTVHLQTLHQHRRTEYRDALYFPFSFQSLHSRFLLILFACLFVCLLACLFVKGGSRSRACIFLRSFLRSRPLGLHVTLPRLKKFPPILLPW